MIWIWVWTVGACEGGDLAAIVAKAKTHNAGVMVKTHDGATANPNGQRAFLLIEALKGAGVPVRAWGYCYPNVDPDVQAFFAAQAGADYIADVEVEWDGHEAEAERFVDALRQKLAGRKIGYAPLPVVSFHDGAGQYEAFNRLDVACPQAYAGTGGRSAIGALQWTEQEWEAAFARCNIEPAVYAADQSPDDLRAALRFVTGMGRKFGNGDASIWSWQHMTDEHWSVVDEFTKEEEMNRDRFNEMFDARLAESPEYVNTTAAIKGALITLAGGEDQLRQAVKDTEYKVVVEALLDVKPAALEPRPTDPPSPAS